jgi:hypothetical protein
MINDLDPLVQQYAQRFRDAYQKNPDYGYLSDSEFFTLPESSPWRLVCLQTPPIRSSSESKGVADGDLPNLSDEFEPKELPGSSPEKAPKKQKRKVSKSKIAFRSTKGFMDKRDHDNDKSEHPLNSTNYDLFDFNHPMQVQNEAFSLENSTIAGQKLNQSSGELVNESIIYSPKQLDPTATHVGNLSAPRKRIFIRDSDSESSNQSVSSFENFLKFQIHDGNRNQLQPNDHPHLHQIQKDQQQSNVCPPILARESDINGSELMDELSCFISPAQGSIEPIQPSLHKGYPIEPSWDSVKNTESTSLNEKGAIFLGKLQALGSSTDDVSNDDNESGKPRDICNQGQNELEIVSTNFNDSRPQRQTKVQARTKIVGLFEKYGDFVKLKPNEIGYSSRPDLEFVSRSHGRTKSTYLKNSPLPSSDKVKLRSTSQDVFLKGHGSQLGERIALDSDDEVKEVYSIPSSHRLLSRDRTEAPFVRKNEAHRSISSQASALKSSVIYPILSRSPADFRPHFLRVASRKLRKQVLRRPTMANLQFAFGTPSKKYFSFHDDSSDEEETQAMLHKMVQEKNYFGELAKSANGTILEFKELLNNNDPGYRFSDSAKIPVITNRNAVKNARFAP